MTGPARPPTADGSSWLRAVLPAQDSARGPRDPLAPAEEAGLRRTAHHALSTLADQTTVFTRRGGSLKIIPRCLAQDDEALALQLARIANALRSAGLSTWWTESGINAAPGPSSPVPPPEQARQFLAERLPDRTPLTSEMIEIAQALLPGN